MAFEDLDEIKNEITKQVPKVIPQTPEEMRANNAGTTEALPKPSPVTIQIQGPPSPKFEAFPLKEALGTPGISREQYWMQQPAWMREAYGIIPQRYSGDWMDPGRKTVFANPALNSPEGPRTPIPWQPRSGGIPTTPTPTSVEPLVNPTNWSEKASFFGPAIPTNETIGKWDKLSAPYKDYMLTGETTPTPDYMRTGETNLPPSPEQGFIDRFLAQKPDVTGTDVAWGKTTGGTPAMPQPNYTFANPALNRSPYEGQGIPTGGGFNQREIASVLGILPNFQGKEISGTDYTKKFIDMLKGSGIPMESTMHTVVGVSQPAVQYAFTGKGLRGMNRWAASKMGPGDPAWTGYANAGWEPVPLGQVSTHPQTTKVGGLAEGIAGHISELLKTASDLETHGDRMNAQKLIAQAHALGTITHAQGTMKAYQSLGTDKLLAAQERFNSALALEAMKQGKVPTYEDRFRELWGKNLDLFYSLPPEKQRAEEARISRSVSDDLAFKQTGTRIPSRIPENKQDYDTIAVTDANGVTHYWRAIPTDDLKGWKTGERLRR